MDRRIPQLYLISPPALVPEACADALESALGAAEEGFVGAFQLRLKHASDAEILAAGKVLLPVCQRHGVAFVLNDRPDLAAEMGADGVHLGQEDTEIWPIARARKQLGDTPIIGVSCHASRHLAMVAGEEGADYVAFGAFYPTRSKSMEKLAVWGTPTPDVLTWCSTSTTLPCVAIGGITPENCVPLVTAGADFIAVITAVWEEAQGPAHAIQRFAHAISSATTPPPIST